MVAEVKPLATESDRTTCAIGQRLGGAPGDNFEEVVQDGATVYVDPDAGACAAGAFGLETARDEAADVAGDDDLGVALEGEDGLGPDHGGVSFVEEGDVGVKAVGRGAEDAPLEDRAVANAGAGEGGGIWEHRALEGDGLKRRGH